MDSHGHHLPVSRFHQGFGDVDCGWSPAIPRTVSMQVSSELHTQACEVSLPCCTACHLTLSTNPSAMTPDSTAKSRSPASWNTLPMIDSRLQIIWKLPIIGIIVSNLDWQFHATSVSLA